MLRPRAVNVLTGGGAPSNASTDGRKLAALAELGPLPDTELDPAPSSSTAALLPPPTPSSRKRTSTFMAQTPSSRVNPIMSPLTPRSAAPGPGLARRTVATTPSSSRQPGEERGLLGAGSDVLLSDRQPVAQTPRSVPFAARWAATPSSGQATGRPRAATGGSGAGAAFSTPSTRNAVGGFGGPRSGGGSWTGRRLRAESDLALSPSTGGYRPWEAAVRSVLPDSATNTPSSRYDAASAPGSPAAASGYGVGPHFTPFVLPSGAAAEVSPATLFANAASPGPMRLIFPPSMQGAAGGARMPLLAVGFPVPAAVSGGAAPASPSTAGGAPAPRPEGASASSEDEAEGESVTASANPSSPRLEAIPFPDLDPGAAAALPYAAVDAHGNVFLPAFALPMLPGPAMVPSAPGTEVAPATGFDNSTNNEAAVVATYMAAAAAAAMDPFLMAASAVAAVAGGYYPGAPVNPLMMVMGGGGDPSNGAWMGGGAPSAPAYLPPAAFYNPGYQSYMPFMMPGQMMTQQGGMQQAQVTTAPQTATAAPAAAAPAAGKGSAAERRRGSVNAPAADAAASGAPGEKRPRSPPAPKSKPASSEPEAVAAPAAIAGSSAERPAACEAATTSQKLPSEVGTASALVQRGAASSCGGPLASAADFLSDLEAALAGLTGSGAALPRLTFPCSLPAGSSSTSALSTLQETAEEKVKAGAVEEAAAAVCSGLAAAWPSLFGDAGAEAALPPTLTAAARFLLAATKTLEKATVAPTGNAEGATPSHGPAAAALAAAAPQLLSLLTWATLKAKDADAVASVARTVALLTSSKQAKGAGTAAVASLLHTSLSAAPASQQQSPLLLASGASFTACLDLATSLEACCGSAASSTWLDACLQSLAAAPIKPGGAPVCLAPVALSLAATPRFADLLEWLWRTGRVETAGAFASGYVAAITEAHAAGSSNAAGLLPPRAWMPVVQAAIKVDGELALWRAVAAGSRLAAAASYDLSGCPRLLRLLATGAPSDTQTSAGGDWASAAYRLLRSGVAPIAAVSESVTTSTPATASAMQTALLAAVPSSVELLGSSYNRLATAGALVLDAGEQGWRPHLEAARALIRAALWGKAVYTAAKAAGMETAPLRERLRELLAAAEAAVAATWSCVAPVLGVSVEGKDAIPWAFSASTSAVPAAAAAGGSQANGWGWGWKVVACAARVLADATVVAAGTGLPSSKPAATALTQALEAGSRARTSGGKAAVAALPLVLIEAARTAEVLGETEVASAWVDEALSATALFSQGAGATGRPPATDIRVWSSVVQYRLRTAAASPAPLAPLLAAVRLVGAALKRLPTTGRLWALAVQAARVAGEVLSAAADWQAFTAALEEACGLPTTPEAVAAAIGVITASGSVPAPDPKLLPAVAAAARSADAAAVDWASVLPLSLACTGLTPCAAATSALPPSHSCGLQGRVVVTALAKVPRSGEVWAELGRALRQAGQGSAPVAHTFAVAASLTQQYGDSLVELAAELQRADGTRAPGVAAGVLAVGAAANPAYGPAWAGNKAWGAYDGCDPTAFLLAALLEEGSSPASPRALAALALVHDLN